MEDVVIINLSVSYNLIIFNFRNILILVGEGHGTGPSHPIVQEAIREMVLGS